MCKKKCYRYKVLKSTKKSATQYGSEKVLHNKVIKKVL